MSYPSLVNHVPPVLSWSLLSCPSFSPILSQTWGLSPHPPFALLHGEGGQDGPAGGEGERGEDGER